MTEPLFEDQCSCSSGTPPLVINTSPISSPMPDDPQQEDDLVEDKFMQKQQYWQQKYSDKHELHRQEDWDRSYALEDDSLERYYFHEHQEESSEQNHQSVTEPIQEEAEDLSCMDVINVLSTPNINISNTVEASQNDRIADPVFETHDDDLNLYLNLVQSMFEMRNLSKKQLFHKLNNMNAHDLRKLHHTYMMIQLQTDLNMYRDVICTNQKQDQQQELHQDQQIMQDLEQTQCYDQSMQHQGKLSEQQILQQQKMIQQAQNMHKKLDAYIKHTLRHEQQVIQPSEEQILHLQHKEQIHQAKQVNHQQEQKSCAPDHPENLPYNQSIHQQYQTQNLYYPHQEQSFYQHHQGQKLHQSHRDQRLYHPYQLQQRPEPTIAEEMTQNQEVTKEVYQTTLNAKQQQPKNQQCPSTIREKVPLKRRKTYYCSICKQYYLKYTLAQHFKSNMHKINVVICGRPDPADLPISEHYRDPDLIDTENSVGSKQAKTLSKLRKNPLGACNGIANAPSSYAHSKEKPVKSKKHAENLTPKLPLAQQNVHENRKELLPCSISTNRQDPYNTKPSEESSNTQNPYVTQNLTNTQSSFIDRSIAYLHESKSTPKNCPQNHDVNLNLTNVQQNVVMEAYKGNSGRIAPSNPPQNIHGIQSLPYNRSSVIYRPYIYDTEIKSLHSNYTQNYHVIPSLTNNQSSVKNEVASERNNLPINLSLNNHSVQSLISSQSIVIHRPYEVDSERCLPSNPSQSLPKTQSSNKTRCYDVDSEQRSSQNNPCVCINISQIINQVYKIKLIMKVKVCLVILFKVLT